MANVQPMEIKSYIVLDLETTGLPSIQFKTKITELSILCLDRSQVLNTHKNKNRKFSPRVVQKLNLCIYPNKLINVGASEVSGLTNELLHNCKSFRDVFHVIDSMINMMEPPVCILAHNGYRFDFPILRSEIESIGKALSCDIYCADTLPGFRALLLRNEVTQRSVMENLDYDVVSELDRTIEIIGLDRTIEIIDDEENDEPALDIDNGSDYDWGSDSLNTELNLAAEEAERKFLLEVQFNTLEEVRLRNETTPKHAKRKSVKVRGNVEKRQLFPDADLKTPKDAKCPKSYRLKDVYAHLTGREIHNAHQADSDTHALLECVVALGPPFLDWVDNHCQLFSGIEKLW